MKQILLQEKFPIFKLEFDKSETEYKTAQEVINYFKQLIDDHDVTRFIAEFDHYSHTKGLLNGYVDEEIIDARNIVFCFGTQLPKAEMLAARPRSIGIAETVNKLVVTFMEAPMALANETMEFWVKSLVNHELKK
jgi:hypothetical protein